MRCLHCEPRIFFRHDRDDRSIGVGFKPAAIRHHRHGHILAAGLDKCFPPFTREKLLYAVNQVGGDASGGEGGTILRDCESLGGRKVQSCRQRLWIGYDSAGQRKHLQIADLLFGKAGHLLYEINEQVPVLLSPEKVFHKDIRAGFDAVVHAFSL